jgi:hypothetical protein
MPFLENLTYNLLFLKPFSWKIMFKETNELSDSFLNCFFLYLISELIDYLILAEIVFINTILAVVLKIVLLSIEFVANIDYILVPFELFHFDLSNYCLKFFFDFHCLKRYDQHFILFFLKIEEFER